MSTQTPTPEAVLRAEPSEQPDLDELQRQIEAILSQGSNTALLISAKGEEVEIPASAFHALQLVVAGMAQGQTMVLVPHGKELTTQEAADLLHVSRPHLVKLLEQGDMPYHYAGSHRRVRIEDVLAYRARRNERRREALQELTRLSEEAPGGYE